jgi:hypothetical protein
VPMPICSIEAHYFLQVSCRKKNGSDICELVQFTCRKYANGVFADFEIPERAQPKILHRP